MAILFVRHRVEDYGKWRRVYDSTESMRKNAGVTAHAVYQADDDPNDITVTHEFRSAEQARGFAQGAELQEAMGRAGVVDKPAVWFAHQM